MSSSRDLRRLVNGLSLIAKEILNRSQSLQKARNGDIQSLISSSVKKAVVSATDLAGITKGKVREFSKPAPKETVVYFSDSSKTATSESAPVEKPDLESNVEVLGGETRREAVDLEKTRECNAGNARELDVAMEEVEGKVLGSENLREVDAGIGTKLEDLREDGVGKDRDFEVLEENRGDKVVLPAKRRRPRERRVPSTPFSRALGLVNNILLYRSMYIEYTYMCLTDMIELLVEFYSMSSFALCNKSICSGNFEFPRFNDTIVVDFSIFLVE